MINERGKKKKKVVNGQEEPQRASVDGTGSVMVEEEHDDALPDDAEPGHLLPQRPTESAASSSSSPALPLLATPTPRLVHRPGPGRPDGGGEVMNRGTEGEEPSTKAPAADALALDLHLGRCCGVLNPARLVGLYRDRGAGNQEGLTSLPLPWAFHATMPMSR